MTITGFTGTQIGTTKPQFTSFFKVYKELSVKEFHHGDCIGSDAEAHVVARTHGSWIVIHPPSSFSKRAFCKGDVYRKPKPYLERNHDIVADTELMIATPIQMAEVRRSGTWATIRYTRILDREIFIIYPGGSIIYEVTLCAVCGLPRRRCTCEFPFPEVDSKTGEYIPRPQGGMFISGERKSRKIVVSEIRMLVR